MIKMKTLFFPSLLSTLIEYMLVKSESELDTKEEHMPPSRCKKSNSLGFEWFE
jgi:hypothetical protein